VLQARWDVPVLLPELQGARAPQSSVPQQQVPEQRPLESLPAWQREGGRPAQLMEEPLGEAVWRRVERQPEERLLGHSEAQMDRQWAPGGQARASPAAQASLWLPPWPLPPRLPAQQGLGNVS
jgi:hypothetical protein